MESRNNNRDFEQFLKQSADQYRMFPSENVWKGIDKALHTRRRWYGLGLALLLLLTGTGVTLVMLTTPHQQAKAPARVTQSTSTTLAVPAPANPQQATTQPPTISGPRIYSYSQTDISINIPATIRVPQPAGSAFEEANLRSVSQSPVSSQMDGTMNEVPTMDMSFPLALNNGLVLPLAPGTLLEEVPVKENESSKSTAEVTPTTERVVDTYPLTIESVINSFTRNRPVKQIELQYYLSPTISYRKLSENKEFMRDAAFSGTVPASVAYNDVNKAVTHKPDIGVELGVAAKYPLTKALKIKAGIQFNVSRYDIRAYNNPGEIATIALDAGSGTNSISRETIYRNYNGNRTNWLQNLYYSAAIPVGLEVKFSSSKASYFAIAATAQPTYIISDKAYLLSTDYKNYVEVPSLIRKWNMNAGFEALVGYSTRNLHWQVGPQVRYQIRSSFQDQYPVKENLFDFGLKVGVTLKK
jgi:hypothetical protein